MGPVAILLHLLAATCFMLYRPKDNTIETKRSNDDTYYHRLFAMLIFFLPGIGILGTITTFISAGVILRRQGLAESYEEGFKMEKEMLFLNESTANIIQDELSIEPIVDILNGNDVALKRGSISLLRKIKDKRAVELIKKCLADESSEVRFYAHTALTRIEADYAEQIKDAQARYTEEKTPYAARALARIYRRYASSGLPEDSILVQYMKDARDLYEKALDADPTDSRLMLTLGNLCAEMKDYMASEKYFRMAVDIAGCQIEAGLGICRALYETGRIEELAHFTQRLRQMPHAQSLSPEKQAVYNLWTQDNDNEELQQSEAAPTGGTA
ncbi:MAG: tetratricopeptide repeat protein [Desulfovibrio sp.]|uniref:HEAT repeat domain-containing protein n=1 Tax=Desulfovibrio sp. 7SRBS1 TaxID=3378064 RepID=UPI003B40F6FE